MILVYLIWFKNEDLKKLHIQNYHASKKLKFIRDRFYHTNLPPITVVHACNKLLKNGMLLSWWLFSTDSGSIIIKTCILGSLLNIIQLRCQSSNNFHSRGHNIGIFSSKVSILQLIHAFCPPL